MKVFRYFLINTGLALTFGYSAQAASDMCYKCNNRAFQIGWFMLAVIFKVLEWISVFLVVAAIWAMITLAMK